MTTVSARARARDILDFEAGGTWTYAGLKEQAIRERFDMSATRYYQVLNGLLDDPAALAYAPLLVRRLLRCGRSGGRSGQRRLRRGASRSTDGRERVKGFVGHVLDGAPVHVDGGWRWTRARYAAAAPAVTPPRRAPSTPRGYDVASGGWAGG